MIASLRQLEMGRADGHLGCEIVPRLCNVADLILLNYTALFNSSEFKRMKDEEIQINVSGIECCSVHQESSWCFPAGSSTAAAGATLQRSGVKKSIGGL